MSPRYVCLFVQTNNLKLCLKSGRGRCKERPLLGDLSLVKSWNYQSFFLVGSEDSSVIKDSTAATKKGMYPKRVSDGSVTCGFSVGTFGQQGLLFQGQEG